MMPTIANSPIPGRVIDQLEAEVPHLAKLCARARAGSKQAVQCLARNALLVATSLPIRDIDALARVSAGQPWCQHRADKLGQRIRNARLDADLTLVALGRALGVKYQQIQAWESGRRNPGRKHLAKLAYVLGLELADLLPRRT